MTKPSSEKMQEQTEARKFGTFLGVFTPSVLTILGLIMYLRFGWVVGNVGLPLTIVIVLLASSITFITALSASAIATNMRVGVGGEYYMISRSLGLELGGAIGIPLFLCRTLSITFYSFGIAESVASFWGSIDPLIIQMLAAVAIVTVTVLSGKSAELVLKLQIPIMLAVGLSIAALVAGAIVGDLRMPELSATYRTVERGFWYIFAVFFPAVTGFAVGIGMSGDLKDPKRAIPRGTILAVITGTLVYLIVPIVLSVSATVSFKELATPGVIWVHVALLGGWLVYPGMWGAILSSAFGSALSGPRVLQSLANDGLAPRVFARLTRTGQPALATWVSGGIALAAVALGELNAVARFVTILFLTLYVIINISAAIEKLVGNPSYRPTINVPWYISLLGAFGAVVVMFLISPLSCVIAIVLEVVLYIYLKERSLQAQWGDVRAGLWMALARFALLRLKEYDLDPRNWRPHFLVFADNLHKRIGLLKLATWFNQNRGLVTVCQLVEGDVGIQPVCVKAKQQEMDQVLANENISAFSEVHVVSDLREAVFPIVQSKGIAGLRCNAVMFGWPSGEGRLPDMLRTMRALSNVGMSTVIARVESDRLSNGCKQIDIWWRGKQSNGDLMLLLAYLLNLNPEWKHARIYLRSIVSDSNEYRVMLESLTEMIAEIRIKAHPEVIVKTSDTTVEEIMHTYSRDADVVFVGLNVPYPGDEEKYADKLISLTAMFKATVLVRNAGEFAGEMI